MRTRTSHPNLSTRRGSVAVWVLLGLTAIVGILALGMDGGRMQDERRRAQATADAAALAAAADLYQNWWSYHGHDDESSARDAARDVAAANGYTNDGVKSIVTVNIPPASGAFAGKAEYAEVITEYRLKGTFGRIFTNKDLVVRGRAVAHGSPARIGLLMLNSTAANAFTNKALAFAVLGNPVIVNSTDPQAFNQASIGPMIASRYEVTGGFVNTGGGLILGKMRTGIRPTADPLRKLAAPNLAASPVRSAGPMVINFLSILSPGVYQGGIQIGGLATVVMLPGVYIMEGGGLKVSGLATVTGLGATIYNTQGAFPAGPITISSLGKIVLTAPVTGPYQGISIFQDRSVAQPLTLSGAGTMACTGTVYVPKADVKLNGLLAAGLDTLGGSYICNTFEVSGVGTLNIDLGNNFPKAPDIAIVE